MTETKLGMRADRPSNARTATTLSELTDKTETVRLKIHGARTGRSAAEVLWEFVDSIINEKTAKQRRFFLPKLH